MNRSLEHLSLSIELFEEGPVVLCIWKNDSSWSVEGISKNIENLLGYTQADFCSNSIVYANLIFPEDLKRVSQEVSDNSANKEKNFIHEPYRIRKSNGEYIWVKDATTIIYNNGEITHYVGYIYDCTKEITLIEELNNANKEIQNSRQMWMDAIEKNGDGLWDWNIVTDEVYFSPQWKKMLGFEENEISNTLAEWEKRVHKDDIAQIERDIEDYISGRSKSYSSEHRVLCKDGSYKWILDRGSITQYQEDGKPLIMTGTHSDIDEQKRSSLENENIKQMFLNMFASHNAIMLLVDWENGNIVDANKSASLFYGYTKEEFKLLNISDINKTLKPQLILHMDEAKKNINNDFEFKHTLKDGTIKDVKVHSSPIQTANKTILYSIIEDISQAKANENRLKELSIKVETDRQHYKAIMENASDGVFIMNTEGRLIECSKRAGEMLGYTIDEMKNLFVYDWDISHTKEESLEHVRNTPTNPISFETKHQRKDGSVYDASITVVKIYIMDIAYIYASVRDITESELLKVEILKEQNFISTIINNSNALIAVIGADGVMFRLNQFGQDFVGYSEDEVKSEPYFWKRFLPNQMQDKVVGIIEEAKKGNIKKSFQNSWISKSGEERFFEWSNALVQHPDGTMDYLVTIGIDITEQSKQLKMIQEKNVQIQKAQLKFQTLFEESLDGIALLDPKTQKFIEFNHQAYEMYGYTKEEFSLLTPKDIDVIHDEEQIILTQQNIIKKGWDRFITKHKTKDGVLKDIIVSIRTINMDNSDILHLTFHDITEQKNKEEQLKTLLNEQEALFKVQTTGFVHLKDRHFQWTNETFERMLGYEKGELQAKPARIMYQDEAEYNNYGKEGYKALTTTGIFTREIRCVKKDGTQLFLLTSMTSLKKNSTEAIGIAFDITAMKVQGELIEKQKEEFETIFNYSKDGIAILDLNYKFLNFNNAYLEITGFTREELFTKSCLELTVPEDRQKSIDAFAYILKYGHIQNVEKSCIVNNNKVITVNMSLSLLPDKKRVLLVTKDVSSLKLFESQAKLASMGEMIGNIAHQWRQPLNVISTMASSIAFKQEFGTLTQEEILPDMENIIAQTNYLSRTIDDFRNFIKGGSTENMINIFSVFEKTFSIVRPSLKNNYITVISNIDETLELKGYENELMQAFINIINNAKDALVANEAIEDKYIFIDAKIVDHHCEITIKDNGGGVMLSVINRIFEPYFTTKHQAHGTGLGLSMAYKIITEMHNGTIEVSNIVFEYKQKKYMGACFNIKLFCPRG
jgi:PAS domain S-box-containing protein